MTRRLTALALGALAALTLATAAPAGNTIKIYTSNPAQTKIYTNVPGNTKVIVGTPGAHGLGPLFGMFGMTPHSAPRAVPIFPFVAVPGPAGHVHAHIHCRAGTTALMFPGRPSVAAAFGFVSAPGVRFAYALPPRAGFDAGCIAFGM